MQLRPTNNQSKAALALLLLVAACGKGEAVQPSEHRLSSDSGTGGPDELSPEPTEPEPTEMSPTTGGGASQEEPHAGLNTTLGAACRSDADCGTSQTCLTSEDDFFTGAGPANGYCTAECVGDEDCMAHDSGGLCLEVSTGRGLCFQGCTQGDVLGQEKCHQRPDVSCDAIGVGLNICRPTCGADEDCGDRFCDLGSGLCVADKPEGLPLGAECDSSAETNECASGTCVELVEGYSTCSGLCTFGAPGCGTTEFLAETPGAAMCLNSTAEGSVGDTGLCLQRCDCDADCLHPDSKCWVIFGDIESSTESIGAAGICIGSSVEDELDDETIFGIDECPERPDVPQGSDASPAAPDAQADAAPARPTSDAATDDSGVDGGDGG